MIILYLQRKLVYTLIHQYTDPLPFDIKLFNRLVFNCNVNVDFPSDHPALSIDLFHFNDEEECEKKAYDETTRG